MIYVIPDFQNPTGVSMSVERPPPPLWSLPTSMTCWCLRTIPTASFALTIRRCPPSRALTRKGCVILLGTFSKTLCPGLRLGWAVAEKEIVSRLTTLRTAADMQCSSIAMYAVDAYLEAADFDGHIREIRRVI